MIQLDLQNLPQDPAFLHQMVLDLIATLRSKDERIEQLQHQLERLQRWQFGRRSERFEDLTPSLFAAAGLEPAQTEPEPLPETPREKPPRKKGHGRTALPKDLPRDRVEYPSPEESLRCECCGETMVKIGEEVTQQLEYKPASFFVREHVRMKYACKGCEGRIVTSEGPSHPIEKGLAGPGLLAHVLTSKYADHLPLYRQERIFRRHGIELSRKTTCGWVRQCADLLMPLYKALKRDVLSSQVVFTDDTTVPVQEKGRKKTKTGRLWVYIGDESHRQVVFDYTPTRARAGPEKFLCDYEGFLQADAYPGYDGVYAKGKVVETGCWSHARRKFCEANTSDPVRSAVAIAMVKGLYDIERRAKEMTPDERKALRQQESKPILALIRKWLDREVTEVLPKSPTGTAMTYALNQWEALERYTENGILEIDNNRAEREIRAVCLGRKNWLFAGSDDGGRRAAVIFSLVASCKQHGIDPFEYLRDVLIRIPDHPINRIDELMPRNWNPLHTETAPEPNATP